VKISIPEGLAKVRLKKAAPAVAVAAIVCILLVPLPPFLMDIAVCFSILSSLAILMAVIRAPGPSSFPMFPTFILVSTLVRLSLNIASTRLILSDGEAGRVIEAFGAFVAGGDVAVGSVIFIIMTVIQLVVVAKGSERVAEVAARFNLDAMPGKQMSIDAELRSGGIDQDEARRRRSALERESRFHGAMDGAMKFVKGDAVAGIVIALVNAAGGLAVGILRKDMGPAEALESYSLLSIGDGLSAQIPSLMVSVAAGIMVTRSGTSEDREGSGWAETGLSAVRGAVLPAGAVMACAAFAPGLPFLPFLIVGAGAVAVSVLLPSATENRGRTEEGESHGSALGPGQVQIDARKPFSLLLPETLLRDWGAGASAATLEEMICGVRERLREAYGIRIPGVSVNAGKSPEGDVSIRLRGAEICRTALPPGLAGLDACLHVADFFESAAVRHLGELIGIQETHELLEELQVSCPALVKETVPRVLTVTRLTGLLRRLLEERVPVTDLRTILEAAASSGPSENTGHLLEIVRGSIRRHLHRASMEGGAGMDVLLADRSLEAAILGATVDSGGRQFLAMDPGTAKSIIASIRDAAEQAGCASNPIIIADASCRRMIWKIAGPEIPGITVLSYQELVPGLNIRAAGRVVLASG
jgi:type III secretion protein V